MTLAQAQSDADGVAATLREQFPPKKNVNLHFSVVGMHADLVSDVRPLVLALFGAVVFVLLIACANVANLLLVRAAARQREFVIRSAIGGNRCRLVRQMLTETMILAGTRRRRRHRPRLRRRRLAGRDGAAASAPCAARFALTARARVQRRRHAR